MQFLIALWLLLVPQTPVNNDPAISLSAEETKAINQYIGYFNESIHGMLIVHRLLENNNQDINKYVDLEGYQINFYSNNDLPKNIFEDPDQWFYEVSPEKMYTKLASANSNLPEALKDKLKSQADGIFQICREVNQIRFDVEKYIDEHDLTEREQLYGVYELLDNAVTLYKNFYSTQKQFELAISPFVKDARSNLSSSNFNRMNTAFANIQKDTRYILDALREKDESKMNILMGGLERSYSEFLEIIEDESKAKGKRTYKYVTIEEKVKEVLEAGRMFMVGTVPKEYKLYGKYYYYHNSNIINKNNRYGNGFVNEMNLILQQQNETFPLYLETPHFFQVIYPMKIIEQDYIISETEVINQLPVELADRKIIENSEVIKAETNLLEIELYDHKMKDNDIVSINFNGDWVFKDLSLETAPKKLKLKLNDTGVNYLVIHAENVGVVSPNTVALKYRIGSKRDEIILESDMDSSAMIEFSLDN